MSNENAENKPAEQVTPAPVTTATVAVAETKKAEIPAVDPAVEAVKKQNAAFAAMRKEAREAKRALEQVKAQSAVPAPAVSEPTEQAKAEVVVVPTAPAQKIAEYDIEEASAKAIETLGADKELATIPGGVLDIVNMVDTDPRLNRLHSVDPTLAFREAKSIYMSKMGVTAAPPVPMPSTPSGGMSGGEMSLEALVAEAENHKPGTKQYNSLVTKIKNMMSGMKSIDD